MADSTGKKKSSRKTYIWGNQFNLGGLLSPKPLKYKYDKELRTWWYDGDFCIEKLGLDEKPCIITFASTSKAEVQAWTDGAKAACSVISGLVSLVSD